MESEKKKVSVTLNSPESHYEILIGHKLLAETGELVRRSVGTGARRTVVISNTRVFDLYGQAVKRSLRNQGFRVIPWLMGDGERFKSLGTVEKALQFFSSSGLERTDAVIALGGGVVGDLAGFAAAIYLRGIPLVHLPTTVNAQIDSAIGGKTGVNLPHGKNRIGSFHHPKAVIVDVDTLKTLPRREQVAGWCEAIKNGAVGSRKLFEQTAKFLSTQSAGDRRTSTSLVSLIKSHCAFKASIVSQDEREATTRTDRRSRRVLNFGHTIGHALEASTDYKRFRHGEAVGQGMKVAAEISKRMGLLKISELRLLREAIRSCGPLPPANDIDADQILSLIRTDKKSVSGTVQWVLLEGIGNPSIVPDKEIPRRVIRESLRYGLAVDG